MAPKEHKELGIRLRTFSSTSLKDNETKCSQEKLNASCKFTAFEWFVLLLIVVVVVCLPLLAVIPQ